MQYVEADGLNMPKLGLGTWPMKGAECQRAVESAIALGYRHIDTAEMYGNEDAVGAALAASGKRGEIHVTTKVWNTHLKPADLRRSFENSLRALRTDYVDLYLIHWPAAGMDLRAALGAMTAFKADGRARAIGVANFSVALMREAVEEIGAPIACNQVEYHVLHGQSAVLAYARRHGIVVTAYSPLAKGRLADYPGLRRIAEKHHATPPQIALAWLLAQDGVAAIPKSSRTETQRANLAALDIVLDDEDRRIIGTLPKDQRLVDMGTGIAWDPAG
jgi:2,5-diketo-D-gluconate reductase B